MKWTHVKDKMPDKDGLYIIRYDHYKNSDGGFNAYYSTNFKDGKGRFTVHPYIIKGQNRIEWIEYNIE